MTRYVFDKVTRRGSKRLPCPVCGKRLARSRTFHQTVNPWNKNPDGTQRTAREIWAALGDEVAEWAKVPEPCASHGAAR